MRIKLINDFHGTEATMLAREENGLHYVRYSAYKRAVNKLCGIRGCQCGGIRGGNYRLVPVYAYFNSENYCEVYYQGARV